MKRESHPLWVRGLKSENLGYDIDWDEVAPFMGAWIEIPAICGADTE